MATYNIYKNGTHHADVEASSMKEAKSKVMQYFGKMMVIYKETIEKPSIYDTALIPYIIAEKITTNEILVDALSDKSEHFYQNNKSFKASIDSREDANTMLLNFMLHWVGFGTNDSKLPSITMLKLFINVICEMEKISKDEARKLYGDFTIAQWHIILKIN